MRWLARFGRFWYDFIVGDDWTIAVVVVLAVAVTALVTHHGWNAWLIMPLCVVGTLAASSWRAVRAHRRVSSSRLPALNAHEVTLSRRS